MEILPIRGGVFESVGHGAVKRDGVCCLFFLNNKKILTYKKNISMVLRR